MFWLVVVLMACAESKYYDSNYELVQVLHQFGFSSESMINWVCLINQESRRRTDVSFPNDEGPGKKYGLFQINETWCNTNYRPGKGCNIPCVDLLKPDITESVICAKRIYRRHKFYAWKAWRDNCKGNVPEFIPIHY